MSVSTEADLVRVLRWDLPTDLFGFLSVIPPTRLAEFFAAPAARAMPDDLRLALVQGGYVDPADLPDMGMPVSEAVLSEFNSAHDRKGRFAPKGAGGGVPWAVKGQGTLGLGGTVGAGHGGGGGGGGGQSLVVVGSDGSMRAGKGPLDRKLAEGKIDEASLEENGGGVSASYRITVGGVRCYAKPEEGLYHGRLRDDIPEGQELEREVAAHVLAQHLDKMIPVPTAVIRTGLPEVDGYSEGSNGEFYQTGPRSRWGLVSPAKSTPEWDSLSDSEQRTRQAAWDSLTANTDRHGGNVYYDSNGSQLPIDHSLAFPERAGSQYNSDWTYSARPLDAGTRKSLETLVSARATVELELRATGISNEAVTGVFVRANAMLTVNRTLSAAEMDNGQEWSDWKPGGTASMLGGSSPSSSSDGAMTWESPHPPNKTSAASSMNPWTTDLSNPTRNDQNATGVDTW